MKKNVIGKIIARFEEAGLRVVAARMMHLSREEAEGFYAVHRERPFFKDLVEFMISGPVLIQVLEGENAIAKNRELMGATDPKKAAKGTIRADFADSIDANAVHGSDGAGDRAQGNRLLLPECEIYARNEGRTCSVSTPPDWSASSRRRARSRSARARCCAGCTSAARPISRR